MQRLQCSFRGRAGRGVSVDVVVVGMAAFVEKRPPKFTNE
jgi:hypothetical protein